MESLVRPLGVASSSATRVSALLPAIVFVMAWVVWATLTMAIAS